MEVFEYSILELHMSGGLEVGPLELSKNGEIAVWVIIFDAIVCLIRGSR